MFPIWHVFWKKPCWKLLSWRKDRVVGMLTFWRTFVASKICPFVLAWVALAWGLLVTDEKLQVPDSLRGSDPFYWMRVILASNRGTLMELLGPRVGPMWGMLSQQWMQPKWLLTSHDILTPLWACGLGLLVGGTLRLGISPIITSGMATWIPVRLNLIGKSRGVKWWSKEV